MEKKLRLKIVPGLILLPFLFFQGAKCSFDSEFFWRASCCLATKIVANLIKVVFDENSLQV